MAQYRPTYEIKIDPEFESLIPPLSEEEFEQLKENILEAGECHDPILVWNSFIVDGHNRWKIIKDNPEIDYHVREMVFLSKDDAKAWMIKNQLGRRNLTKEMQSYLRGQRYELEKKTQGTNNQYTQQENENHQNEVFHSGSTAERLAEEYGVSKATIERDAQFAKGVDAIKESDPDKANEILNGKSKVSKEQIRLIVQKNQHEKANISGFSIVDKPQAPKIYSFKNNQAEDAKKETIDPAQERLISIMENRLDGAIGIVRDYLKSEKAIVTDEMVENVIEAAKNKLDKLLNDYYQQTL